MASRSNQAGGNRGIRGPQSALTDFLHSQNISARQIRANADARRAAAEANNAGASNAADSNDEDAAAEEAEVVTRRSKKRKAQAAVIDKIKKTKAYKRQKRNAGDSDDSDDLAEAIFEKREKDKMPGQIANCAICEKRFTVTTYTPAGPNGGLLCAKCGKEIKKDDARPKKKKPAAAAGAGRRKVQSRILDGTLPVGAKSLMNLCIETLAKNIGLADSLGDLPYSMIDRIARILSKRRLLDQKTVQLFLRSETEEIPIYDGSFLFPGDYVRIFQTAPKLKRFKLVNGIQFKDEVMKYLMTRNIELTSFSIHGANLISEEVWKEYLKVKGKHLECLQVYYTDKHLNDNVMESIKTHCTQLKRLKIVHNQQVTDKGVECIAHLKGLEHLSLGHFLKPKTTEAYVKVVRAIGGSLRTLSLEGVDEPGRDLGDFDDRLLDAIHASCKSLSKLRLTCSKTMTDAGFARLFAHWPNKALTFVDLSKCRHVDAARPRENAHAVGLCSDGFRALMRHSGRHLRHLNVHACRDISREAFEDVFAADKVYPDLVYLEVSFCEQVTDFVCGSIFRSCPNLRELNVFGCMKVKEVRVPKNRILVGVPNAVGMVKEGQDD